MTEALWVHETLVARGVLHEILDDEWIEALRAEALAAMLAKIKGEGNKDVQNSRSQKNISKNPYLNSLAQYPTLDCQY